jgi:hypothetical protein
VLRTLVDASGLGIANIVVLLVGFFAIAGLAYGRAFMRAANDRRGGWLFGISYGFLLWMLGPTTLTLLFTGTPLVIGRPAQGMFAAHLLYGVVLGLVFPLVHDAVRRRHVDLGSQENRAGLTPGRWGATREEARGGTSIPGRASTPPTISP